MLTGRRLTPEHMDDPHATRAEQVVALKFLRRVNARLGGARAAISHLRRWSKDWPRERAIDARLPSPQPSPKGRGSVRILDVGTGSADIPLAIVRWARRADHDVHITAIDRHPVTCELAREFIREQGEDERITVVEADALRLMEMFQPGSFDYAHAGLFLHHLHDVEVMTVLAMMDRLTTRGVIWNDLVRAPLPRLLLCPLLIGAPPKLRHDAIVSVQAGFTKREAIDLAQRAGLRNLRYRRHMLHRFTLASQKSKVEMSKGETSQ
jgi:ubiquinone/menaquinone biosynthesis C-methylase UbiE